MSSGTDELRALAVALGNVPRIGLQAAVAETEAVGEELRSDWVSNATATAGEHGKHYPSSITAELQFGINTITVEVGPDSSKRQGGMGPGFEYGSVNQPPHLDGNKAADGHEAEFATRVADAVAAAVASGIVSTAPSGPALVQYTTRAGVTRMATAAQVANWTRGSTT